MPIDLAMINGVLALANVPNQLEINKATGEGQVAIAQAMGGMVTGLSKQISSNISNASSKSDLEQKMQKIAAYRQILGIEANVPLTSDMITEAKALLAAV